MHEKTLEELSFFRIREEISGYCASHEAREEFKKRNPLTDEKKISFLKSLCSQWMKILNSEFSFSINSWEEINSLFKILKVEGASLESAQIFSLYGFIISSIRTAEKINSASKILTVKELCETADKIPVTPLKNAALKIEKIFNADGTLKDLPVLREIKAKISSIKIEIDRALKKYTGDQKFSSVLASNVPALRAERQVLAVKANMRTRISGIVHEVSASGQTMFIEPEEVVRKNNELIQEEFSLKAEIKKIFNGLTSELKEFTEEFKFTLETMILLDQTLASARWAVEKNCICAQTCKKTEIPILVKARHPILEEKAVPIDMKFPDGKRILIITGPNTGGKTVSIKTFALLSMMNQAGFPVPAAEGTKLPVFNKIFADIGDEQSIDQSLSTFSAHMKNIAAAVKFADENSLVLLDELGSGTDPQEGGAIAMAVLDELIEKKPLVLVTTHHGILKNYGYTNPSCVNASVEFDTDTLSPTYRILTGIPGESHALEIAKRSGLPVKTVNSAKSYIKSEQADVSKLIKGLTEKHAELFELEKEMHAREAKISEKEIKNERKSIELKELELSLRERETNEESKFLRETRSRLENLVRILREGEITREKNLMVKNFISSLTAQTEENENELEAEKNSLEKAKSDFTKKDAEFSYAENGMRISSEKENRRNSKKQKSRKKTDTKEAFKNAKNTYSMEEIEKLSDNRKSAEKTINETKEFTEGAEILHTPTKMTGILLNREKKSVWKVQIGSLKMNISEKDMKVIKMPGTLHSDSENQWQKNIPSYTVELSGDATGLLKPQFELRLLGMRAEEALKTLERQLDLCQMMNFRHFSVIHGKGDGILQQAVRNYLENYPGVKSFSFAPPEDGGSGKTYVEME